MKDDSMQYKNLLIDENGKNYIKYTNQEMTNSNLTNAKPAKDSTFFNTLMNLLNGLLGAGILSIPSSFASAGIIPSLIIIIIISCMCYFSSLINIKLFQKNTCTDFDELVLKIMGKWGSNIYTIIVIIFLSASMIAYLIIGCDNIISWLTFAGINCSNFIYRAILVLIYSLILPIPLMIPKDFFLIGIFSTASIFFIIFYIISTIIKSIIFFKNNSISKTMVIAKFDFSIFSAIGVYSLTFALPVVVVTILHPYSREYKKRRNVVMTCFIITSFMTIFPSIIMYLMFGSESEGNILNSFPSNDILFTIVRIGFFLVVTFSFPVCGKVAMWNWSQLIFKRNLVNELKSIEYWTVLLISTIIPVGFAMLLPQCKPVISIGGSLGGCLAIYTYPSILWIIDSGKKWKDRSNLGYVIYAIIGLILSGISTYQSIVEAIASFKSKI